MSERAIDRDSMSDLARAAASVEFFVIRLSIRAAREWKAHHFRVWRKYFSRLKLNYRRRGRRRCRRRSYAGSIGGLVAPTRRRKN